MSNKIREAEAKFDNNNTGHAEDPAKTSGVSPPLTLDGEPIKAGQAYVLTEDFRPPSRSKNRNANARQVKHPKGTRFVAEKNGTLLQVVPPWFYRARARVWPDDREYESLVGALRFVVHDGRSVVQAMCGNADELLGQLWCLGKVTTEDLALAAEIDNAHAEALEDEQLTRSEKEEASERAIEATATSDAHGAEVLS